MVARPVLWGGAAALALLALASPALGMRLADPGLHDLPTSVPVVRNLLADPARLPRRPGPGRGRRDRPGPVGASRSARRSLPCRGGRRRAGPLREPVTATLLGHGRVLVVSVPLAGDGTDATSISALATLRDRVLPATLGKVGGISYAVTGNTASNHDFTAAARPAPPLVFVFVLGPGVPAAAAHVPLGRDPADVDQR